MQDTPDIRKRFFDILAGCFGALNKQVPDATAVRFWFGVLQPYELADVSHAFSIYGATATDWAPTPAKILAILNRGTHQHLGPDEAWAQALLSVDEAATVVWSNLVAKAFYICRPVLDGGDKIGARKAFIDAYSRLVEQAKLRNEPPVYQASLGTDQARRQDVLQHAVDLRLLPPTVAGLLPAPEVDQAEADTAAREAIALLREMVGQANRIREEKAGEIDQAAIDAVNTRKNEIQRQVEAYQAEQRKPK